MDQGEEKGVWMDSVFPLSGCRLAHAWKRTWSKSSRLWQNILMSPLAICLKGLFYMRFEQKHPFGEETLKRIAQLKDVYGMDYDASASHRFIDQTSHNEPS